MELLKIDDHFIVSDFVSNGSFASLRENIQYKSNEDYAILVRITDFVKKWNGDYVYINETEYNFLNKSKVFPGDLIISNVGQPGLSFILPNLNKKTSLAPNSIFVRPKTDKVYNLYFYYFLRTPDAQKIIESICTQTTLKKFNKTSFRNLILPFPSYENQIRIAHLLEKIEATLAERKNAIDLLDELVKATFYEMFGDPVVSKKFERIKFEKISKVRQGLQIPISERKSTPGPNRFPYITNQFINGGKIAEFIENPSLRVICSKEDVLMTRTGNTGIVITNVEGVFHNNFFLIDFNRQILAKDFLVQYLKFDSIKRKILKVASVTTIPDLNHKDFYDIDIILPPIELQNQFADIAQKIEIIKTEQEAQLKHLEELYASISHKVFEGDIDLSKVPFDAIFLPNLVEVTKEESIEKPEVILHQEAPKEQIKKVIKPIKGKLTWENISFKEVADYIQHEFDGYYFNAEMLLRYLREDIGIFVNYFSSAEQKKNPQYENADDFYRFIATALTGENHFLQLEQVFYNAETENIPNISFTQTDVENLSKKDKKERSGIYFRIKNETTTP